MKKTLSLSILLSSILFGAGYQIPNHSINAQALATANVANAHGSDATYYNPANMVYNDKYHSIEITTSYVILEPVVYNSSDDNYDIESEKITTVIPSFHYVSQSLNDKGIRVGFSLLSPAGLTRKWKDMPASATSKKYMLKVLELNPTLAIPITPKLSIGLGFRYVMAKGEVDLDSGALYSLSMKGDGEAAGYNLALSYNPTKVLNISATYRSKISLRLDGDSDANFMGVPISSKGSIDAPIPANFIFAIAYKFSTKTTLEVTYDKTYWSTITETNFEFDNPTLEATLGKSTLKEWNDSVAYRVGLTQEVNSFTLMTGFAYSETASKDESYVTFSSPDTDFLTYSIGARYKLNESLEIGATALLARGEEREVSQVVSTGAELNGILRERDIYVFSFGMEYQF